jgi:hypothetical protein
MAEIRVEKKRTNMLPWIIGLILLGLVLWAVSRMGRDDGRATAGERTGAVIELNHETATPLAALTTETGVQRAA